MKSYSKINGLNCPITIFRIEYWLKKKKERKKSTCLDVTLYIRLYFQTYGKYSALFCDQSPRSLAFVLDL